MFDVRIYDKGKIIEKKLTEVTGLSKCEKVWVDLNDFREEEAWMLKEEFHLHSLTTEDCLRARTRIKFEEFRKYIYLVLKGVIYKKKQRYEFEQINLISGPNFILTVSYRRVKNFERLKNDQKKLLDLFEKGPGLSYLVHHFVDQEVDHFFPLLEKLDEHFEALEKRFFDQDQATNLKAIMDLKTEVVANKKVISAMREIVHALSRHEMKFIDPESMIYYRDIHDHLIRLSEMIEGYRDLISTTFEAQLAMSSYRMNDIMRILTVFTVMFSPAMIITSFYGMNFHYLPLLGQKWGFLIVILFTLVFDGWMYIYFKKKKWL